MIAENARIEPENARIGDENARIETSNPWIDAKNAWMYRMESNESIQFLLQTTSIELSFCQLNKEKNESEHPLRRSLAILCNLCYSELDC